MNTRRLVIGILVAVLVGLVASNFVYRQLARVSAMVPQEVKFDQIVVAAGRLPLGTRLESQHLRQVAWSARDPLPGAFRNAEDVVGRALVTWVAENEPILDGKLAPREAGGGLPATIPEGMRALSVRVNEVVAVAGFVVPGTMVDVLVTGSPRGQGGGDNITRTILENIRVLAAGQSIEQDKNGKPQTVPVITLLVTPDEATKLTMASTEGRIQLALRNTIDTKKTEPLPIQQVALFAGAAPPPAPKRRAGATAPPPRAYEVEVLRGGKREVNKF